MAASKSQVKPVAQFSTSTATLLESDRPAQLTVSRRVPVTGPAARDRISVLLLRLGHQRWGPLPDADAGPELADPVELRIDDAAGISFGGGASDVIIHELRCLPPEDNQFPWPAVPSLVAASAEFIERKASELPGHTLLLGTTMPPEAALGLGILAGQVSRTGWPGTMWPLVYRASARTLVVPRLNLGVSALRDPEDG